MKGIKLRLYFIFLGALTFVFSSVIIGYLGRYEQLQATDQEINIQIEAEKEKSQRLNEELLFNQSDAFVEKIARERLNLVKPDEYLFYNDEK